jgi:hypothetical protein
MKIFSIIKISAALLLVIFVVAYFSTERSSPREAPSLVVPKGGGMKSVDVSKNVLEVIGLGVTLDGYRQESLWGAIKAGNSFSTIRNMDPKNYPWAAMEKSALSSMREGASLENALLDTPRYWGIPVFNAEIRCLDDSCRDRPDYPQGGLVEGSMGMHLFVLEHRELAERPDRILEQVFLFFERNPDVPFVAVGSADSSELRRRYALDRQRDADGYEVPQRPDASTLLVLARRERVESLRRHVFDDVEEPNRDIFALNRYGIARQIFLAYLNLRKKLPVPSAVDNPVFMGAERQPTSTEWLAETAKIAVRPDILAAAKVSLSTLTNKLGIQQRPQLRGDWKPTPWFPVPWNREQLEAFDRLPTLGYLHRPVFVKMQDSEGAALSKDSARVKALGSGWKEIMSTQSNEEQSQQPARIIISTGNDKKQLVNFHGMLRDVAETGGREFDPTNPVEFIDTDRRLGDTGATTFFMQIAIGLLGSYREGGLSAAFNLREKDEASMILISPPSEKKRREQQHPIGGDVFRNATVPAIDPKNYEEPVMNGPRK